MAQAEKESGVGVEQRKAVIHAQRCFAELTNEECRQLAELLKEVHVAAGERIVQETDPVDSVYFILKGNADVRHVTYQEGVPHIQSVATLKEGGTIGLNDAGFYSLTGRRTATVVANTDMLLLKLSLPVFHGFALVNRHVSKVMREQALGMLRMR